MFITSNFSFSHSVLYLFKSLPNHKILDQSKFKELAEDKINATKKFELGLRMVENILGKGENAGNQHFLLFPKCFQKAFFFRVVKSHHCVIMG